MQTFTEKVRAIVAKIPKGKTMTYKEVATRAGNPEGARRRDYAPGITTAIFRATAW